MTEAYSFSLLPGGFPTTGLVEISGNLGSGKTESIFYFLKENPSLEVAWVEKEFTLYPPLFEAFSLSLKKVLFVELKKAPPLWCVSQLLRSQTFQVILCSNLSFSELDLRRLQILTKQTGGVVLFLENFPRQEGRWPLSLQVKAYRSDLSLKLELLKTRRIEQWNQVSFASGS